ncbi:MAG: porphobilinogen synthase, partial [Gammaproteobacteria bacterium]|nr:porphobilinogen synthase [Gammaproteobacteria bacterium]
MLWSGAKDGLFSLEKAVLESLYAQKRAGAEKIITYFAALAAELLSTIP